MTNESGGMKRLDEITNGGGIAVFLSASCPYCRATLPVWEKVHDELAGEGISFVGVSMDTGEAASEYIRSQKLDWPLWWARRAAQRVEMGVQAVPQTIVVDPDGEIRFLWRGLLNPGFEETVLAAAAEVGLISDAWPRAGGSPGGSR